MSLRAYNADGIFLGEKSARDPSRLRPLLEQSVTSEELLPYSSAAWSVTVPWQWVQERVQLRLSVDRELQVYVHGIVLVCAPLVSGFLTTALHLTHIPHACVSPLR